MLTVPGSGKFRTHTGSRKTKTKLAHVAGQELVKPLWAQGLLLAVKRGGSFKALV